MNEFERGFTEELEKIGVLSWAIPGALFGGWGAAKAIKEQAMGPERTEEARQKSYFTKYPSLSALGITGPALWGTGKGLEAYGRRGETGLHRAASATAGTLGEWWTGMDPAVALQRGLGL
jgi:hypothetical protein